MNIFITGGASGLGEAITRRLAADASFTVYFTYAVSEANAKILAETFPNVIAVKCDFKQQADIDGLKERLATANIDVLINNAYAGAFIDTHFHKISSDIFLEEFKNNIVPAAEITQAAIHCFRKKKSGKIITILSAALLNKPPAGAAVYTANKAYLESLTKTWASENAKFNISSNSISPGFMETAMTGNMDERLIEQIRESHPHKKLLTTQEVADTVMFLVNASPQINGVNIVMNAGENII